MRSQVNENSKVSVFIIETKHGTNTYLVQYCLIV